MSGLSGEVPQSLGKMQQLGYLDIAGNMLTGSLPAVTSSNMINLRLAENFLTGTISASYGAASVPCSVPLCFRVVSRLGGCPTHHLMDPAVTPKLDDVQSCEYWFSGIYQQAREMHADVQV